MSSPGKYLALASSPSRSELSSALDVIITTPPSTITQSTRKQLIQALLHDLATPGKGRLTSKDAAKALLALKSLGRDPLGSELLSSPGNLSALLSLAVSYKDDPEASSEALRCIANALLLIENSRETFLKPPVNGGDFCLNALEKATAPELIFVLARILFLSTAFSASYIVTLIDAKGQGRTVVEIITAKLDLLLGNVENNTKMAREATSDVLKFTYNIVHHYPKAVQDNPQSQAALEDERKVLGDFWSPKLDGLLAPLLRLFTSLPTTSPNPITAPLTHVIHALMGIPVTPALKNTWFPPTLASRSSTNTPKSSAPQTPHSDNRTDSRSGSPVPQSPASSKPSTFDRALSILAGGRRSLSRSSPQLSPSNVDVLQRAWDLLEVAFDHFFPGSADPDDLQVRERIKKESPDNSLDDLLSPLVILVTRLCMADEISQARLKQWLVPDDLDRSSPLEQRPDMLGKCLRLLPSVYHARLKDSVGEMLYVMAGSDASNLTALVGYGNVAGYLFNKGILSPPPASSVSGESGASISEDINPITGTKSQPKADLPEMTEEEKEREVEKLLWLFDRLERTGAIPADQNPIRKAIQEGKATLGP